MNQDKIIISNQDNFAKVKDAIIADGAAQLHLISDFDRTLTSSLSHGKLSGSLISILRDHQYLTPDYPAKAHALADHYRPIENDPALPLAEKKAAMMEWWTKHFNLLIASGLTKQNIEDAMQESGVELREGVVELITLLKSKNIPLVIFSASGLGYDSIAYFLGRHNLMSDNIHIVSNRFQWNEANQAVGIIPPIIHSFNKDENSLHNLPFYHEVAKRQNAILLGDSLGDIGMTSGLTHKNIMKFCFIGDSDQGKIDSLKEAYDAIVADDGSVGAVIDLISQL